MCSILYNSTMIDFLKRIFTRENFETVATLKTYVTWNARFNQKKMSEDIITWYMEQGDRGTRRYNFHSFGDTNTTESEHRYESELILWKKTGILPENAEPIEFTVMKRTK